MGKFDNCGFRLSALRKALNGEHKSITVVPSVGTPFEMRVSPTSDLDSMRNSCARSLNPGEELERPLHAPGTFHVHRTPNSWGISGVCKQLSHLESEGEQRIPVKLEAGQ